MKPTPTPEQIEDAAKAAFTKAQSVYRADHDHFPIKHTWETTSESVREGWRKIAGSTLSAALSVPAAAVVGEPVGYVSAPELMQLKTGVSCVDLFREPQPGGIDFAPVYAAPSAPDGWQPIETAPKDGTEFLAFGYYRYPGDENDTSYMIVATYSGDPEWPWHDEEGDHPPGFLSHWQPLPAPPALGGEK